MKLLRKKITSIALIVTMLITLLPVMVANAAGTITITNLYSPPAGTPDSAVDQSAVNRFTLNPITVDFLINGIPDDQVSNIFYEIYNLNGSVSTVNTTNKPVKSTSNSSQVSFQNVQLTPGLNKITVKYGTSGTIASAPAFAFYTPVTNISALKFSGDDFVDGGMFPKKPPYTGLTITGTSSNATEVEANSLGNVYPPSAFTNGTFTFVANTGRTTDLAFRPGDNVTTFAAKNNTNYYTTTRSFVYDNGLAFAYNAKIDKQGTTPPTTKLVTSPTITDSNIQNVVVSAKIKNPLTASSVTQYVYADIFTTGKASYNIHYDFTSSTPTTTVTGGGTLNSNGSATPTPTTPSIAIDNFNSTSTYKLYDFIGDLPINTVNPYQEVNFKFTDANGNVTYSKYNFSYANPSNPYVDHLGLIRTTSGGGSYETTISESGSTQITDFPASFKVYTNNMAKSVQVLLNGVVYVDNSSGAPVSSFPVTVASGIGTATFKLQGIQDGPIVMQVVPYDAGGTSNQPGIKLYNLVISGSPYVIINNIFNGIVVNAPAQLKCTSTAASPCISGRLVNLPVSDYSAVKFFLNDIPLDITTSPIDSTNGTFKIINFNASGTTTSVFQSDGKYTLKIVLSLNGVPTTTTSLDIFVLSDNVPAVGFLKPIEADPLNPQFKAGTLPATYVTRATSVQLQGQIFNSAINTVAPAPGTVLYLRKSATTPTSGTTAIGLTPGTPDPDPISGGHPFNMAAPFAMTEYGDYVFELVAANGTSGSTANKLVTITREPVPYSFFSPKQSQIITNSAGKDQANINQNYYMIELLADKADSVTFGKEAAVFDKVSGHYFYEAKNLKAGANEIKFTVNRGASKTNGSIVLVNQNTGIEGAQYKTPINAALKVFEGDLQIKFPKNTKLMRNDSTNVNQYITTDRQILFGIANNLDGRIDKANETQIGTNFLAEPTGRFRPASKRFWVDAGSIYVPGGSTSTPDLQDALLGGGYLPNLTSVTSSKPTFYTRNYKDQVIPTERGTLTLKYDSNIRDDSWRYLSVYQYGYFDNPNGQPGQSATWKNIGGVVDPKSNTITVSIDSFGYFQVMYMDESFNDVTNHPWARNDLDTLYSKGIMFPKTPGQFMPNDAISRGEFVTMLVKIFDVPLVNKETETNTLGLSSGTFVDVQRGFGIPGSNGLYDFISIEAAARTGIVRGSSNGTFLPNNAITRQDAAVMIARAADLKVTTDEAKSLTALQKQFTDANNIDFYALGAVEAVSKAALIEGKENVLLEGKKKTLRFDPLENFTRAEAATVAMRVLKQQKKVPK